MLSDPKVLEAECAPDDAQEPITDTFWPSVRQQFEADPTAYKRFKPECIMCTNKMGLDYWPEDPCLCGGMCVCRCGHIVGVHCLTKWMQCRQRRNLPPSCPVCSSDLGRYKTSNVPMIHVPQFKPCTHVNSMGVLKHSLAPLQYCPTCLIIGNLQTIVDGRLKWDHPLLFRFLRRNGMIKVAGVEGTTEPIYFSFATMAEADEDQPADSYVFFRPLETRIWSEMQDVARGYASDMKFLRYDYPKSTEVAIEIGLRKTVTNLELQSSFLLNQPYARVAALHRSLYRAIVGRARQTKS